MIEEALPLKPLLPIIPVDGGDEFVRRLPRTEEQATANVPEDWHCGYHIYVRQ